MHQIGDAAWPPSGLWVKYTDTARGEEGPEPLQKRGSDDDLLCVQSMPISRSAAGIASSSVHSRGTELLSDRSLDVERLDWREDGPTWKSFQIHKRPEPKILYEAVLELWPRLVCVVEEASG